jgi:hypothetical protein
VTCQRCGVEAELGECPGPCRRWLCVACYDGDQEDGPCRLPSLMQRNDAIRVLRGGGAPAREIAERFSLSVMTISRVMRE